MNFKLSFTVLAALLCVAGCETTGNSAGGANKSFANLGNRADSGNRETGWGLRNCYKVSGGVYRAEQPSSWSFKQLDKAGFKSVVNLRGDRKDNDDAKGTGLELIQVPCNASTMTLDDLYKAVDAIENAPKPVLVHCLQGSDRTGVVIAAYRILVDGWSRKQAIAEMKQDEFGFHDSLYPNLVRLLNRLPEKN